MGYLKFPRDEIKTNFCRQPSYTKSEFHSIQGRLCCALSVPFYAANIVFKPGVYLASSIAHLAVGTIKELGSTILSDQALEGKRHFKTAAYYTVSAGLTPLTQSAQLFKATFGILYTPAYYKDGNETIRKLKKLQNSRAKNAAKNGEFTLVEKLILLNNKNKVKKRLKKAGVLIDRPFSGSHVVADAEGFIDLSTYRKKASPKIAINLNNYANDEVLLGEMQRYADILISCYYVCKDNKIFEDFLAQVEEENQGDAPLCIGTIDEEMRSLVALVNDHLRKQAA